MTNILAGHTPNRRTVDLLVDLEPTAADLVAIEVEMPAILADLERLDDEQRAARPNTRPDTLDDRRQRRARRQLAARRIAEINVVARRTAEHRTDGAA